MKASTEDKLWRDKNELKIYEKVKSDAEKMMITSFLSISHNFF